MSPFLQSRNVPFPVPWRPSLDSPGGVNGGSGATGGHGPAAVRSAPGRASSSGDVMATYLAVLGVISLVLAPLAQGSEQCPDKAKDPTYLSCQVDAERVSCKPSKLLLETQCQDLVLYHHQLPEYPQNQRRRGCAGLGAGQLYCHRTGRSRQPRCGQRPAAASFRCSRLGGGQPVQISSTDDAPREHRHKDPFLLGGIRLSKARRKGGSVKVRRLGASDGESLWALVASLAAGGGGGVPFGPKAQNRLPAKLPRRFAAPKERQNAASTPRQTTPTAQTDAKRPQKPPSKSLIGD